MIKTYGAELVEELVDKIESLALHKRSLQNQLDKVDAIFVGTRYNWQGSGKGRIEMLKMALAAAEAQEEAPDD